LLYFLVLTSTTIISPLMSLFLTEYLVLCSYFFIYSTSAITLLFVLLIVLLRDLQMTRALSIVTKSVAKAAVDLFYFINILTMVFLFYVFIGFYALGQADERFRSPLSVAEQLFLWIAGQVDWDNLILTRPGIAHVYSYSFILFFILILVNMLIAIVIGSYESIKEERANVIEMENKDKSFDFFKSLGKWVYRFKNRISKKKKSILLTLK